MKTRSANHIIKKETRILLVVTALVIVFLDPLERMFNAIVVDPILSQVQSSLSVDFILLGFLFWMLYDSWRKFTKRTDMGRGYVATLVFILGCYVHYRFFANTYTLTGFSSFPGITYLDMVMGYGLLLVLVSFLQRMMRNKNSTADQAAGLLDEPIDDEEEDILKRMPKVRLLADEIIAASNKHSIAFGVTGEWGSGKTSFLNLVERELEKRGQGDLLVLNFNPWLNLGTTTIIQEFFELLRLKIRPESYDLYMDMGKYSRNILKLSPSSLFQFLGHLLDFGKNDSVTEDFKRINTSLKRLGKKFLIVLDDMDRLKADEVFEILKLIRNTANFDNFIYLVAYDKTYISESLNKIGIPKNEKFAEKIFLKEENLLPITEARIKKFLSDRLKEELPSRLKEIDNYFGYTMRSLTGDKGDFCLKHIRDVKRFLQNFLSEYKKIEQEVDFKDYLNIKLLKFKFYDVYRVLFLDPHYYLSPSQNTSNASGVHRDARQLAYEGETKNEYRNRFLKFEDSRLGIHATEVLRIHGDSLKDLQKLVSDIFRNNTYGSKSHLSIVFSSHYYRYFQDILEEHEISELVFNTEIEKDLDSIQNTISKWKEQGKLDAVRARFYEVKTYELPDRKSFEKIIKATFFLASMERENDKYHMGYYGYDPVSLRNIIGDHDNIVSNKFYDGQREKLKDFVENLMHSKEYSTMFCANLLNWWYSHYHGENWILSKKEIKQYILNSFKNYTKKVTVPDGDVWNYYSNCLVTEWDPTGPSSRTSRKERFLEANYIFIAFIENYLDHFLVKFIQTPRMYGFDGADKLGIISIVNDIFENRSNFMDFLNDMKQKKDKGNLASEFIDEYHEFATQLLASGDEGIVFDFKYPPAREALESHVWQRA
ncbi:KAP family P-loop NTPase fold protein [Arenibacter algicola]|uniref:KAP family P-loop NTPase fold protein n=1 Tax=Arenibacter algicola TaxID=616991 RepID=UPI0004DF2967|nr:P-loop NTPase fold protein [Arenibacter algicola]